MHHKSKIQLNAPAGNLSSLMAAVDAGADSVYAGFRSPTNLRNLPGVAAGQPVMVKSGWGSQITSGEKV